METAVIIDAARDGTFYSIVGALKICGNTDAAPRGGTLDCRASVDGR
jgi:hypothetical protein